MDLVTNFKALSLAGKSAVELLPTASSDQKSGKDKDLDIYYLQITQYTGTHSSPVSDGPLAILCSTQNVRIFDAERLMRTATIAGGKEDKQVTKVRFGHEHKDLIYTSCLDPSIRCWDLRTDLKSPVSTYSVTDSKGRSFLSLDLTYNDKFLCGGTKLKKEDAFVYFWDLRKSESVQCYEDLHSDDITQVRFHPTKQDFLLTCSDDGLVNCLDVGQANEADALQQTLDTQSTPDRISWAGDNNSLVSTFCNTVYIWNTDSGDELAKHSITEFQESCKEHVDSLVDGFLDLSGEVRLLSTSERGEGHIFSLSKSLSYSCTLTGGHSSSIRACTYNTMTNSFYTVGEDALLCCWKATGPTTDQKKSPSQKPIKSKHKKADSKPYSRPRS